MNKRTGMASTSSLPGLTRQSSKQEFFGKMDARVKPAHAG
jgi:hypothetical protein